MVIENIDSIRAEVRQRRKDKGWSQKWLAIKAGVSHNTVFLLENSSNDIYLDSLLKILTALGMKLEMGNASAPASKREVFRYG